MTENRSGQRQMNKIIKIGRMPDVTIKTSTSERNQEMQAGLGRGAGNEVRTDFIEDDNEIELVEVYIYLGKELRMS